MSKNVLAVAVVVLLAGTAGVLAGDLGLLAAGEPGGSAAAPVPAGGQEDGSGAATPTATPTATGTPAGATAGTATPYAFSIERIEECGRTCRDVTVTLTNEQSQTGSNVTVYTRIFAGNGTDGDVVWTGTEPVGRLGAGESYTATERVDLSLTEAYAVKQRDGWVTVQVTVTDDDGTMTFTRRRDVA